MNRTLLIFIVSLIIYIGYTLDLKSNVYQIINQLLLLNAKIEQNKLFLEKKKEIKKELQKQFMIDKRNKEKLFPATTNDSIVLGEIQSFIKKSADDLKIEVVLSNWGEPIEENGYKKLPVSFTIRAYPKQFKLFLDKIYSYKKLLKIETLTIGVYKKEKLVIALTISGYKLEKRSD